MISLFRLFLIYVKIGAILLGGGYVILPIMISEFCEKRALVDKQEIVDYFALSQSLPGIIAANMSMFVGYKLKGVFGAIVAMFGIIFVPFICIIVLAAILESFVNNTIVKSSFYGVEIAVIALIILTLREIWQKSDKDLFFYLIFTIALALLLFLHLSPIKTIIIVSVIGLLYKFIRRTK